MFPCDDTYTQHILNICQALIDYYKVDPSIVTWWTTKFYTIVFAALRYIFGTGEHWWEVTSIPDVTIL